VVELPSETVDYEAELVVVIGERAHRIAREDAWAHVAGLTLGQDGWARDPKVVLRPGDRLVTHAEVIGEMTITFTAPAP
jgi:2-keto-4-pentenoate hydratase/2-oxohepta-3-ene-1,7-dioic acid hydratase in catechol pathway